MSSFGNNGMRGTSVTPSFSAGARSGYRRSPRDRLEPRGAPGMPVAPSEVLKAEVQGTEGARDADVADAERRALQLRRLALDDVERIRDLEGEGRQPVRILLRRRLVAFVPPQDQRVEHPVPERVPAQRLP